MSTVNRRSFIVGLLASLPAATLASQARDLAPEQTPAEKSYDAIVAWLREDEWEMGNGQCHDCCGLAPDGTPRSYGGVTSWGSSHPHMHRPLGHAPTCKRAMSLELLGAPVVWAGRGSL
jgi:hypothetical protein